MKALIFDLEGVVIDTEIIWDEEAKIFLERRGIIFRRDELKHIMSGKSILETCKFLKNHFDLDESPEEMAEERKELFLKLAQRDIGYIDGFPEFYDKVKKSYKTAIATAMDKTLFAAVDKKIHLTGLFNGKVFHIADVGGKSKPDPAVFLLAAKEMNIGPENCTVIEDSPLGIDGAKRAGMICIGITTTYPKELLKEADKIITDYKEIVL